MQISIKDVSPVKKEIEVIVPATVVDEELGEAYERISKKAKIKGFRPGKIPRSVLEQYYSQDAEGEAVRHLIERSYPEAVREAGIHPVSSPEISVTSFGPSRDFSYLAVVEIPPVIEVKGYTELNLTKDKMDVTEEEIRENLKGLQERMTQLVPIQESRVPKAEDVVVLDFQGRLENRPVTGFQAKDYVAELGKGALFPEIESGILQMTAGEKKTIDVTYPSDWSDKKIAGRSVSVEIHLKELKEKKKPELTDDFAKDLGNFSTLEDVKVKIREEVLKAKEQQEKNKLRRQVVEKLIEGNEFSVPDGMIQMELEEMFRRIEGNLKAQGLTAEQAGLSRPDFFEKNREEAAFRVKGALLFDAVAHKEGIGVTPEEVDRRIEEMARLSGQSADRWKKYYNDNGLIFQVENALREEKTLDFVLTKSKIKIKE